MKISPFQTSGSSPTHGETCSETLVRDFATNHHLKVSRDADNSTIIPGKLGHIFQYSDTELGVIFIPSSPPRPRLWNRLRVQAEASGMVGRQLGDAEGSFAFDPRNDGQVKLAIRIAGARPKRQYSPDQLMQMRIRLEAARQNRPSP